MTDQTGAGKRLAETAGKLSYLVIQTRHPQDWTALNREDGTRWRWDLDRHTWVRDDRPWADCTCGYGGQHEPENPDCELNQANIEEETE